MKSFNLTIETILEKELYSTPPLVRVIVAKLVGAKQDIPRACRVTNKMDEGLSELKHLRRIRNLPNGDIECIVAMSFRKPDMDDEEEIKSIEEKYKSENLFKDYRFTHVPVTAPRTDHQLKACTDVWPCKFAKSAYLNQCIQGSLFVEPERLVLKIIVNSLLNYISSNSNKCESAAVVFRCAKIYGVGLVNSETLSNNPVKHSTMISIDSVATNAGAGHWKCNENEEIQNSIQEQLDKEEKLKDHRIDAHFLPYLCTNYDIFVTEEPCFLCTMGLVQSRIRRLFFLDNSSANVSTGCKQLCYPDKAIRDFLVHRDKRLNHRFEAWKITLVPEE